MNCFVEIFDVYASLQKQWVGCLTACIRMGCWWDLPLDQMEASFLCMISNKSLSFGNVDA